MQCTILRIKTYLLISQQKQRCKEESRRDIICNSISRIALEEEFQKTQGHEQTICTKIGGWYIMSSAKKRQKTPEKLDEEAPSWKEILDANQANHDVYSQFARFPRNTILPSLKHRKAHELELQRNSPRPDLYQLNNNWAV